MWAIEYRDRHRWLMRTSGKFPLRPAIRFAAVSTQATLREAWQVNSRVGLLPDSPENLAYSPNIRVEGRGEALLDLQPKADSRVEAFVPRALEPLAPGVIGTGLAGAMPAIRAQKLFVSPLTIEAVAATREPALCAERIPVVAPDLIPGPGSIHTYGGPPAPAIVPSVALRTGMGPAASGHFRQVSNGVLQPPLVVWSRECDFPLRPAIRCAVVPTATSLREAWQATSNISLVPDSPASLGYPQNIRFAGQGTPLAELQLRVDSKVESFVSSQIDPLSPADAVTTSADVSFSSWGSSIRLATGRELPVGSWQPVPMFGGSTTMLPPQASWSSVFDGLHDRMFSPRLRSYSRAQPDEVVLKTRTPGLPPSMLPVPWDFRWQRRRKLWDRAGRWKRYGDSVYLPTISFYPSASAEGSPLDGRQDLV